MTDKNIKYIISKDIINNYIKTINSTRISMNKLKKENNQCIININNVIHDFLIKFPNEKANIYIDIIKQIMIYNNGMLSTRMIEPLNISRQYLSIMEKNNEIERISRGIYLARDSFEDSYFSFQMKFKKTIFSHMNALYFYDMTEEFPYNYTVTVPQSYHTDAVNNKCSVFYVSDDIYELGMVEVETPNGNKVRAYDLERSICDIIRSKGRMNPEQINKTIEAYSKSEYKDLAKLVDYANKMGIRNKVMEMVGE